MLKKGYTGQSLPPMEPASTEPGLLPMTAEQLRLFLIQAFSSNYKSKFGTNHIVAKNVFSISSLVSGPGTTYGNYKRNIAERDPVTGEEPKVFNTGMFRGSAIHDYSIEKLPKFYAYEKITVREEFAYEWKDPSLKTIVIVGHPDFVHYGELRLGDLILGDKSTSLVLELKTIYSQEKDPKKLAQYKANVLKKAKRQVGCYAILLKNEIQRYHYPYVATFDENPDQHLITEADKAAGFIMINNGETKLPLDEKMLKRGYVYDSTIRVYSVNTGEMWQGYNYCKWAARETAKKIEEEEINGKI